MRTKTTIPVSSARKKIFSIVKEVQNPGTHYTLTERGVPKAVLMSSEKFESLMKKEADKLVGFLGGGKLSSSAGSLIFDEAEKKYSVKGEGLFSKILIARDASALYAKDNLKLKEEGYIKAILLIELTGEYGYPLDSIEIGRCVQVGGSNGKKYVEADILAGDKKGDVRAVFEVAPFDDYEKDKDRVVSNLYDIAEAVSWRKKPMYLVYYSRAMKLGSVKEKISVIDYRKSKTFEAWKEAGRPAEGKIPGRSFLI